MERQNREQLILDVFEKVLSISNENIFTKEQAVEALKKAIELTSIFYPDSDKEKIEVEDIDEILEPVCRS